MPPPPEAMKNRTCAEIQQTVIRTQPQRLCYDEWRSKATAYEQMIREITLPYRTRRMVGDKHPVYDFLFQYYSFSSTKLEHWHPGWGITLEIPTTKIRQEPAFQHPSYVQHEDGLFLELPNKGMNFLRRLDWTIELLTRLQNKKPRFGCFGLHEWAMIQTDSLSRRHNQYALRVSQETLIRVTQELQLQCSHYDAFRFFTKEAADRNRVQLASNSRIDNEQPGCVHVNMDLYKWCFMFSPWVSSDLLGECFTLALRARELDMRASPYDLSGLGYEPICIELPEGRAEYQREQEDLSRTAYPLRQNLLLVLEKIFEATKEDENLHRAKTGYRKSPRI